MTYTPKQLSLMTDVEINRAVLGKLKHLDNVLCQLLLMHNNVSGFNPCRYWNDVMPIAEKYGISYIQDYSLAVNDISDFVKCYMNGNPLDTFIESNNPNLKRAICEVFLMMEMKKGDYNGMLEWNLSII